MGCAAYRPNSAEKMSVFLPVISIAASVVVISILHGNGAIRLGHLLWTMGLLYPAVFLTILAHEIGHIVAAAAVGMRATRLIVGSGPVLWSGHIGRLTIEWRPFPASGRAAAHPRSDHQPIWRQVTYISGGIIANAICALLAWGILHGWGHALSRSLYEIVNLAMWVNAGSAVGNLIPYTARLGQAKLPTDGKRLLTLVRGREAPSSSIVARAIGETALLAGARRYADAHELLRHAVTAVPGNTLLMALHVGVMGEILPRRGVIEWFAAHEPSVGDKDAGTPAHAMLYASAAWVAVEARDPSLAATARSFAQIATDQKLPSAEIDGIYAATLIADGEPAKGVTLALDAMRRTEQESFRAALAVHLADGLRATRNEAAADEITSLSAHLKGRDDVDVLACNRRLSALSSVPA